MHMTNLALRYPLQVGICLALVLFMGSALLPAQSQEREQDLERVRQEEEQDYFAKWVDGDVRYIIMPDEKDVFRSLTTNEEKERFIEQFWFRRDPDPNTAFNEFQEEHYRRIAYSNEWFYAGTPGWLTDRGRIYIIHGEPDQIESHEAGESYYDRDPQEGGGSTSTFPFIRWWYRHIDGIGDNVELEFVDKRYSGSYMLVDNPWEKDQLMHTNFGATWAEEAGVATRADRYRYSPHRGDNPYMNYRAQDNPFEKYRRFHLVQAAQPVKYKDFEKLVDVNVSFEVLPVNLRMDYLQLDENRVLVPITVQMENKYLDFTEEANVRVARLGVYMRISSLTKRVVSESEDDIMTAYQPQLFQKGLTEISMYQKIVTLERKGRYKLDLVVKDLRSGKVGVVQQAIIPPSYGQQKMSSSSLILSAYIRTLDEIPDEDQMFVLGDVRIRPSMTRVFRMDRSMGAYLQLYNVGVDQTDQTPALKVTYRIMKDGQSVQEWVEEDGESVQYYSPRRVVLIKVLPLGDLSPGDYQLYIEAHDQINNQTVSTQDDFQVVENLQVALGER